MKRIALAVFTLTLTLSGNADATGFLAARFGGEMGHPTTANPTALYYNPAGLTLGTGTRLYIDGTFALRHVSYDRPVEAIDTVLQPGDTGLGTPAADVGVNSGKAELTNFIASPAAAFVSDLGIPNLGVGLGFFVPFGGQAVWGENDKYKDSKTYPGAVNGVQRWSTIEGTIRSLYFTAGGAYRIAPLHLSLGLGLNLVKSEVNTIRARDPNGTDDVVSQSVAGTTALYEGRSWIEASNTTFSVSGGLIWEPARGLYVGASYQSQPGFGELSYDGTLSTAVGTSPATDTKITFTQSLPDVIRFGGRYRSFEGENPAWELRLFGELDRWSVLVNQCILNAEIDGSKCSVTASGAPASDGKNIILNIPREWKDAWGLRGGFSYWFSPALEGFVGLGWDGNAVPDSTVDASLIDMPKVTGSLGASYDAGSLSITGTYTHVLYFDRTVEQADVKEYQSPSKNPSGAGKYTQNIDLLVVGIGYDF